jgi:hypothetical protein
VSGSVDCQRCWPVPRVWKTNHAHFAPPGHEAPVIKRMGCAAEAADGHRLARIRLCGDRHRIMPVRADWLVAPGPWSKIRENIGHVGHAGSVPAGSAHTNHRFDHHRPHQARSSGSANWTASRAPSTELSRWWSPVARKILAASCHAVIALSNWPTLCRARPRLLSAMASP